MEKKNLIKTIVKETIDRLINEAKTISEFQFNGHNLSIVDYDMSDDDDKEYVLANKETIWSILQKGYESLGGFKGFQTIRDMIKKSPFYKLGFCDGEIVTVTVYNGYLGGSKCVGATCVKDDRHSDAVKLLELIIEHNITDWERWIWLEASGKIEEMCKKAGAFNVPNKFVHIYLGEIPVSMLENDDFHYKRKVRGNDEIKTIFGFKDKATYETIKNELNLKIKDNLGLKEDIIKESTDKEGWKLYHDYMSKKHPVYIQKNIIDYFVYLKDDEGYNEFTEEMVSVLKTAMSKVKTYLSTEKFTDKEKYWLEMSLEEGDRVLNSVTLLKPIEFGFSA